MLLAPTPLGNRKLAPEILSSDKKNCRKIGPCGLGKEALYIGSGFRERRSYLPWREVKRVFKRVAMSRGGFSGRGLFGSLSYLVVQYGSGREIQCRFRHEEDVDRLLEQVEREHPSIHTHSAEAEKKLADAAAAEEARYAKELSPEASAAAERLRKDTEYLEARSALCEKLTAAAKQKRIIDNMSPAFRIGGAVLGVLGILAAVWGLYGLAARMSKALFFVIGGGAVFFLTLSTNTFPTKWNSRKTGQKDWEAAVSAMRAYLGERETFPVPAQYAHPVVLGRMIRVLREDRAQSEEEALAVMKKDLKALNSTVQVSQKEYDEVVKIKPLFLVCDYQDEI